MHKFEIRSGKLQEFYDITHQIRDDLGRYSAISILMQQRCCEYRDIVTFLKVHSTKEFYKITRDLY